ncbi:MAG: PAS domain-containing protein, partial [Pseudomonadota bacterium]
MIVFLIGSLAAVGAVIWTSPDIQFALIAAMGGCFAAAFLLTWRSLRTRALVRGDLRAALKLMEHDPAPCFCTDDTGAIVTANKAAERRFGDRAGQPMARAITGILPNAAAVVFRHETALDKRDVAHEVIVTPRGPVKLTAYQLAEGVLWRIDDHAVSAHHSGDGISLPMMVVSQADTILSMNTAMRDVLGRRATTLEDVFADLPVVPGRRTRVVSADGP